MNRQTAIAFILVVAPLILASPSSAQDTPEIQQAHQLLRDVSQRYSQLPALIDEMTTKFSMHGRPDEESTIRVRFSKDAAEATGIVPPQTLDVYAVDGALYLQLKGVEGVVKADLGESPIECAKRVMGIAYPYLPPQIMLRWTDGINNIGECFTLGMLKNAVVTGYAESGTGAQTQREVIFQGTAPLLDGSPGTCRAYFDPRTDLLTRIVIDAGTDAAEPTFRMTANFAPQTPPQLNEPIVFDIPDERVRFPNFKAMLGILLGGGVTVNPSIAVGAPAPQFDLLDQNGHHHTSTQHLGKLVVLDWWGSWCAPCRRDLPKMQALHEHYADNPRVVILAMNVGDDNAKMEKFWAESGFAFPTLNDADDLAIQFGIKAYPSVVLIGPDGTVLHAEAGSASDIAETLAKALDSTD